MTNKFRNLLDKMPKERRNHIEKETNRLIAEMPLHELRKALQLTQQQVAAMLSIKQVAVSKMEGQADMYVSTLRRFIEAMGGELRIVAHFPQGDVEINQFTQGEGEDNQVSAA